MLLTLKAKQSRLKIAFKHRVKATVLDNTRNHLRNGQQGNLMIGGLSATLSANLSSVYGALSGTSSTSGSGLPFRGDTGGEPAFDIAAVWLAY